MKVKVKHAGKNASLTVGKEYDTTYVESKNFLEYGYPYFELINDDGEPMGWAPCDRDHIDWEVKPRITDAHGREAMIPMSMRHLVSEDYIAAGYVQESDFYEEEK